MNEFAREIPALIRTVSGWLNANRLQADGRPFLRYHVIDMPERMDVELGIPLEDTPNDQGGGLSIAVLPAGRYAVCTYEGTEKGISANKALIDWIADQGEDIARHALPAGEAFEARYETFLTDAQSAPNHEKLKTEIAIKLRD